MARRAHGRSRAASTLDPRRRNACCWRLSERSVVARVVLRPPVSRRLKNQPFSILPPLVFEECRDSTIGAPIVLLRED